MSKVVNKMFCKQISWIYFFLKQCLFLILTGFFLFSCTNSPELKISRSETFFNNLITEPANLHPIRSTDYYSAVVQYYILESLLQRNDNTYEWEPALAKNWEISQDGKTFTFELYEGLKWSDGKALTVQDVKFTFEARKNPKYGGITSLPYFEKLDSATILKDGKIQFKAKEPYFGNFQVIASMDIIPEHIYKDPEARLSKTLIGSGPYKLENYIKGKILVLKQNPYWAGKNNLANQGKWNFKTMVFRFVKTETDTLLRMQKEHLDFSYLSAESFFEKTNKPPWGTRINKVKYQNKMPSGYRYIGFNLKKPLFQDQRIRKALAHLLNRDLINKKFLYDQAELARGPWYFWSEYADPNVPPIKFDPKKAVGLLNLAGWKDEDKNGVLEKTIKGQKKEFIFTVIFSNPESEKYLTLYQEDLKQAGIQLKLKVLDWTSFLRLLDDKNFDAVMLGWSGGSNLDHDPKQIWHTESSRGKGSNFISYSNSKVDALIDKGRLQLDKKERVKTFREVYRLIAEDVPYIFFFNRHNRFYAAHKRINRPADTFNYSNGLSYWSLKVQP